MIGIYCITNKINGKRYVGQSTNIQNRWKSELRDARKNDQSQYITRAINKYGVDNFKFEILELCKVSELNKKERYWIRKLDTFNTGYNETLGGQVTINAQLTDDMVEKISYLLKATVIEQKDIAKMFGVSNDCIWAINAERSYIRDNVEYPIRPKEITLLRRKDLPNKDILKKMVEKDGYTKTAEKFNVSDSCIRDRLKKDIVIMINKATQEDVERLWNEGKSRQEIMNILQIGIRQINTHFKNLGILKNEINKRSKTNKKIAQYSLNGTFIKEFNSIREANISCGASINNSLISRVASGKRKSAYGYIWKYVEE